MTSMDERDDHAAARSIVATLGEEGTRDLLRLLESDDLTRADTFRQLHARGGHDALLDALAELEADPVMRGWLIEHLRAELQYEP
jgi:hypothetical protein